MDIGFHGEALNSTCFCTATARVAGAPGTNLTLTGMGVIVNLELQSEVACKFAVQGLHKE